MSSFSSMPPRVINPDGTVTIHCRQCGRPIAKVANPIIRTVTRCAICNGAPPDRVLPQYIPGDPTKPAVPLTMEDPVYLYEDEAEAAQQQTPWPGISRPMFRMLGLKLVEAAQAVLKKIEPESKKIARRKKMGGLFEK